MATGRYPRVEVTADPSPRTAPFRFTVEKLTDCSPQTPAQIKISCEYRASTAQSIGSGEDDVEIVKRRGTRRVVFSSRLVERLRQLGAQSETAGTNEGANRGVVIGST
ncbi:hypothetical protein [Halegenticoccus soli]|uniref:hypothetical protein n=1 Tax=Halegenticoccus soli TaxID=1985678 RepID=UPI001179DA60|nr:hypothetical protein [Halegenticoccus soli]